MTRKNLFFLVIAFIFGVTVWIFFVNRGLQETQDILVEQAHRPQRQTASVSKSTPFRNDVGERDLFRRQLLSEYQSLQNQLLQNQELLVKEQGLLKELQVQQQLQKGESESSLITSANAQIQDSLAELQNYESLEKDINQRADALLRDQNSQAQLLKEQLDERLRVQETLIRQTQEDLTFWQYNGSYVNEREARLNELRALLEDQSRELANLRAQRLQISSDVLTQTRAFEMDKSEALAEISDSREQLREEIQNLRDEVLRLQERQSQRRMSQLSLGAQIYQKQKDLERARQQQEELSRRLLQKDEEIKLLKN